MRKKITLAVVAAAALTFGGAHLTSVVLAGGANPEPAATEAQKKSGNGFARALGAPFRALARIFSGGKGEKKPAAAPQRTTEKDAASFESAIMTRVSNTEVGEAAPAAASASAPGAGYSAFDKVAQARRMLEQERVSEAIGLLSSAATVAPDMAAAHHLLGYAYDRKGLRQLSYHHYESALRLAPDDAQLLNDYGRTLYLRGDYKAAKAHLKKATKLAPADERIWNNLALAQCKLEDYDDAFKSFRQAGGEFKARMNVANMLERTGRDKDALKHYEAARKLNPESRSVLQHLIDVYHRLGRRDDAEAARQALSAPPQTKSKSEAGGGL